MSTLKDATDALRDLEALLRTPLQEGLDPVAIAEQVREVRQLLSGEDARWVGATKAKQLLGVGSENTVKAWARRGLLGSRKLPNGRVQVLLDDVLRRRAENEALLAIEGEDLSPEERNILKEERPGKNPWEREKAEQPG
jgi:hypothetical protein